MYWFIAAIVIGSGIFWLAPATPKVTADTQTHSYRANPLLLLLSSIITLWLLLTHTSHDKLIPASLFIGVLAITATLTMPRLRRYLLPSALVTASLMLLNLLMMF